MAAICGSSVTYPPGYPLFTLLGKMFTALPFGTVAWRVNFMSAICDAMAALFIFLAVARYTKNKWAGLVAGSLFAFAPLIWQYAISSEVFALNNMFLSLLLYLAVCYEQEQKSKYIFAAAFVFGLGMSHHHTIMFFALPLGAWMFWRGSKDVANIKVFLVALIVGVIGMLPYLYLPWASKNTKELSWGDQTTWQGFLDHLFRRQYGTFNLASENAANQTGFLENILLYLERLPGEFFVVGLIFAFFAIRSLVREKDKKSVVFLTLVSYLFYVIVFFALANLSHHSELFKGIFARFFQMPNVLLYFLAGIGAAILFKQWQDKKHWAAITAVFCLLGPLSVNFKNNNQRNNYVNQNFGKTLLEALPKDAVYVSSGDHTSFILQYLQTCEGVRPDVAVFSEAYLSFDWAASYIEKKFPEIVLPGPRLTLVPGTGYRYKDFIMINGLNALFLRKDPYAPIDRSLQYHYQKLPFGPGSVVVHKSYSDIESYVSLSRKALPDFEAGGEVAERYPRGSWEFLAWAEYWNSRFRLGKAYVQLARRKEIGKFRKLLLDNAVDVLVKTAKAYPGDPDFKFYLYMGEAYSLMPDYEKMVEAWANYLNFAPPDEPNYKAIQGVVKKYQRKTSSAKKEKGGTTQKDAKRE